MARVKIEDALPPEILRLRFNQDVIAERFGSFRTFLKNYDTEAIGRKRRPEIIKLIEDHYDKYGSSDSDEIDEDVARLRSHISVSVSDADDTDSNSGV